MRFGDAIAAALMAKSKSVAAVPRHLAEATSLSTIHRKIVKSIGVATKLVAHSQVFRPYTLDYFYASIKLHDDRWL